MKIMFKKLKIKLMLLNLAVAGVILLGISAASFTIISNNIKNRSEQSFQMLIDDFMVQQSQNVPFGPGTVMGMGIMADMDSFYIVSTDVDKKPRLQLNSNSPIDSDMINKVIDLALHDPEEDGQTYHIQSSQFISGPASGSLSSGDPNEYSLVVKRKDDTVDFGNGQVFRYAAVYGANNTYVVIQNLSQERVFLINVGIILLGCVLGGLLLLSLGGLFLAERSIRPIRLSWQKQRDFVADASHELRTPLAAIRSNIDVVLDDPHATVQEKQLYCQGIAEESKRMSYLVDNLLMLARADSDAVIFLNEPVDLSEVVQGAADLMQPVAAKKDIALELIVHDAPEISGDADRIKQVLLQLIDNAIKYTPHGGWVKVSADRIRDNALLTVSDSGIGIAPEHIGKVFDRFYRIDESREREVGGHGLGLSIAKFIVERHGGTITAASAEGQGSTFTVTLPVDKDL